MAEMLQPVTLEWFQAQDSDTRRETLQALAQQGGDEAVEVLISGLRDTHPGVQQEAVHGLIASANRSVVQRLLGLLRDTTEVRNMAIEVIEQVLPENLETVVSSLHSPDPHVRKFVVDMFVKRGDPRAMSSLTALLSDPDPNVRASAAEAVGRLRARTAVPTLVNLLHDEEWVVFSVIEALAAIGDPSALEPLLALSRESHGVVSAAAIEAIGDLDRRGETLPMLVGLATSAGDDLRPAVIRTLVKLTETSRTDVWARCHRDTWVPMLVALLQDDELPTRVAAMTGLGLLGDRQGTQPIIDMLRWLEQPSEEVMDQAVRALVGTGETECLIEAVALEQEAVSTMAIRALGQLRALEAIPALIGVRRTSQDWKRRRVALRSLAMMQSQEALAGLIEAINDETGYVRQVAIRLLGDCGHRPALANALTRLKSERYQEVRDEIVNTVVRLGINEGVHEVLELMSHPRSETREAAATILGLVKPLEGLDVLIAAGNDVEWRVRRAAMEALGSYDDERAVHSLLLAMSDDHEKVRVAATDGLARWNTAAARMALVEQGLRDQDVWVRYRAAERLGFHRVVEAIPALVGVVRGKREPRLVQRAALSALAQIGGPQAKAALTALVVHEDEDLRATAEQALRECRPDPAAERMGKR